MCLYYIHRYTQLTPAFLLIVLVSINLTSYFGNESIDSTQTEFETSECASKYW